MKRRVVIAAAVIVLVAIGVYAYLFFDAFSRMKRGYVYDSAESFEYLDRVVRDDLGYSDLQLKWVKGSWVIGFQDHTRLFKLTLPREEISRFAALFEGESSVEGNSIFEGAAWGLGRPRRGGIQNRSTGYRFGRSTPTSATGG